MMQRSSLARVASLPACCRPSTGTTASVKWRCMAVHTVYLIAGASEELCVAQQQRSAHMSHGPASVMCCAMAAVNPLFSSTNHAGCPSEEADVP
jgi:hypothetical protein